MRAGLSPTVSKKPCKINFRVIPAKAGVTAQKTGHPSGSLYKPPSQYTPETVLSMHGRASKCHAPKIIELAHAMTPAKNMQLKKARFPRDEDFVRIYHFLRIVFEESSCAYNPPTLRESSRNIITGIFSRN